MLIKQIRLKNFRNFHDKEIALNPFLTIIIGQNSRGKTNILESVYFIINGSGFREKKEDELINLDQDKAYVEGVFAIGSDALTFQITLQKNGELVEKNYFINNTKKKSQDYLKEQTKAVLFSPDQLNIITGAPDLRRSYFNKLIYYYDYDYKKRVTNYEAALRKRNRVLEFYQDEQKLFDELSFWNDYLEEQAAYITQRRQEYVNYLNQNKNIDHEEFEVEYLKKVFDKEHLKQVFAQEKRYRQTLIGPQKDDYKIYLKKDGFKKDIQLFGSRSEQRLGIFWLKLNEIKYYESRYKKKPIVLLDDIFSEFDLANRRLIFEEVKKYQTVLTTTESELLDLTEMPKSVVKL